MVRVDKNKIALQQTPFSSRVISGGSSSGSGTGDETGDEAGDEAGGDCGKTCAEITGPLFKTLFARPRRATFAITFGGIA